MDAIFKNYLFDKHILVCDTPKDEDNAFAVIFAFANRLGIRITGGYELANTDVFEFASLTLGYYIPEPFYKGFPETVKKLTSEELLFDQLYHYFNTYFLGNFEKPGHSIFEDDFERIAFKEGYTVKEFEIVDEKTAVLKIFDICDDLVKSSRPLAEYQYEFLLAAFNRYSYRPKKFESKDTLIRLIIDTKNMSYASLLSLSDVPKVIERILYDYDYDYDLDYLNLKNSDRKFVSALLDSIFEIAHLNVRECYEKRKIWVGLLHHIHYKPKSEAGEKFVSEMRGKGKNKSVYSEFEAAIAAGEIKRATDVILRGKGSGALLRNLNYLLSRAKTDEDIEYIIGKIDTKNAIMLIQLLISYANYKAKEARTFKFIKYGMLVHHNESEEEQARRLSVLDEALIIRIKKTIKRKLEELLSCKLGKIYIDPDMKNVALPIQESASMGGFGCLPRGSRIKIPKTKKIRAFTYWEKVNDIDLAMIGLDADGNQTEFSWRTIFLEENQDAIVFSGDQTAGYEGGSEYYDVDLELFKKRHPAIKYLICTNSVYSGVPFSEIVCTAGYMTRDIEDSGEVFEPKTVKSSFKVTADSTTAYIFAIDIKENEFIWLNIADESMRIVAGTEDISFIEEYLHATDVINMSDFFSMLATEVVESPEDADIIVSDKESDIVEGKETIRSYDFEKVMALMNI
ncbi:MAG: hypothetical protein IJD79_07025 [Clostridia bacterium]|nr:hypothetical protein [Clostridia bacterium]